MSELFKGEVFNNSKADLKITTENPEIINKKYVDGEVRIVTEQARYPLPSLTQLFNDNKSKYNLRPEFQRRRRWSNAKKSKLIESFIINVPVPPVFLYEIDYASFEVMDGLQRITSIIDFYNDDFALETLDEWNELNGMKYSQLPEKIKEGIDRRYLSSIILMKESAKNNTQADKLKKLVFERLNSGGVKLSAQETRNALYDGKMNRLCLDLSKNSTFQKLWNIVALDDTQIELEHYVDDDDDDGDIRDNKLYKDMSDVELVLRFFAFRHVDKFSGRLDVFLDNFLQVSNDYKEDILTNLKVMFIRTIELSEKLFDEYAFKQYKLSRGKSIWSEPQRTIYDPMMMVLSAIDDSQINWDIDSDNRVNQLKSMFEKNRDIFNGKKQAKNDIIARRDILSSFIKSLCIEDN